MSIGSVYLEAQNAVSSEDRKALEEEIAEYIPQASTSSILSKLQSLPRQQPQASTSSSFQLQDHASVSRINKEGVLEELTWSGSRVVWTLGNSIERVFDFDATADASYASKASLTVRQALWTNFLCEAPGDHNNSNSSKSSHPPSSSAQGHSIDKARELFGPFASPLAASWTDARPLKSDNAGAPLVPFNAICVFLAESLHIFFPSTGRSFVLHMPFLLKRAWSLPETGLLLERHLEADEQASPASFGLDATLPTLYSLKDPFDEMRFVSLTIDRQPAPATQPFTSARSDILLYAHQYNLVLLFDRHLGRLQLCRVDDVEPKKLATPHLDSLKQYGVVSHPLPPTSAPSESEQQPRQAARNPGPKRPSMARTLSSATLGGGAGSTSLHAGPSGPDRTFVGGEGTAAPTTEMSTHPTLSGATQLQTEGIQEQEGAQCELCLKMVWESSPADLQVDGYDQITAVLFDEQKRKAFFAVHSAQKQLVHLLILGVDDQPTVVHGRQESAYRVLRCISTRPNIHDLLLVSSDGTLRLLTADAFELSDHLPHLSEPTSISITGHLLRSPASASESMDLRCFAVADQLAQRAWEALSLVLSTREFFLLFRFMATRRQQTKTEWQVLEDALLGPQEQPASTSSDTLFDELLKDRGQLQESSSARRSTCRRKLPAYLRNGAEVCIRMLKALHLLFESQTTIQSNWQDSQRLGYLCSHLAARVKYVDWVGHYSSLGLHHSEDVDVYPVCIDIEETSGHAPDFTLLISSMLRVPMMKTPSLKDIAASNQLLASSFFGEDVQPDESIVDLLSVYNLFKGSDYPEGMSQRAPAIVEALHRVGFTSESLGDLSFALALPLKEALRSCSGKPPQDWPPELYELVGRSDLARQAGGKVKSTPGELQAEPTPGIDACSQLSDEHSSSTKEKKTQPTKIRPNVETDLPIFNDRRLEEVASVLNWSSPVTVKMANVSESGEPPPREDQMAFAVNVAARTQSLPAGAALFNYRTRPALRGNENVAIPDITLAVKLVPIGVVITPDISALPGERRRWPKFHSGVAAALSQRVDDPEGYDNSDIAFNKPASDLDSRHAGYLFGLGLTGQIRSMAVFQAFSYLDPKHELTSIGVLLGLSSAFIGTADPKVSSVLAVHLSALHPAGSAELNITLLTQSAAMLGVGLLHMSTRRRSMADTVLRELPRIVLRNKEHSESCREAYALSAGFAFGMIMLAHGGDGPGPADESLLRKFKALIDGDGQNPLPGSNGNTGNGVDVSTTAPAAIVALSLMFLDADRADVLDLLQLPHSEACLDYIRPDLILMRTIGRCLIQLSKIQPTVEYVNSQLPEFVLKAAKRFDETGSFSSMDLEVTYWSIVGGICFAIGLRFAGTGSVQVHTLLSGYLTTLYRPLNVRTNTIRGKLRSHALQGTFNMVLVALGMVFAGSGELGILRRIRLLHGHVNSFRNYGSHAAVHTALGLLFLGGGKQTISSSSPGQLACLFVAFYPIWPKSPSDNRMHLQAYRHLWVHAVEPRCLRVRDVDTNQHIHMPMRIKYKGLGDQGALQPGGAVIGHAVAPVLLPELGSIESIGLDSVRYWPVTLNLEAQVSQRESLVHDQTIYVKRHAGRMDYTIDPRGTKGINSRSGLDADSIVSERGQANLVSLATGSDLESIVSCFSSDPNAVAVLKYLGDGGGDAPLGCEEGQHSRLLEAFIKSVAMEGLVADKIDMFRIHHSMFIAAGHTGSSSSPSPPPALLALRALLFSLEFYSSLTWLRLFFPGAEHSNEKQGHRSPLVERTFVERLSTRLEQELQPLRELHSPERAMMLEYMTGKSTVVPPELARMLLILKSPELSKVQALKTVVCEALKQSAGSAADEALIKTAIQQAHARETFFPSRPGPRLWAELIVESCRADM